MAPSHLYHRWSILCFAVDADLPSAARSTPLRVACRTQSRRLTTRQRGRQRGVSCSVCGQARRTVVVLTTPEADTWL